MSFYPEDFRFNIYVLWPFKQRTERFSEDKYKIAAYIIVFSLRAFCCIIYDGKISQWAPVYACDGRPKYDMKDNQKDFEANL